MASNDNHPIEGYGRDEPGGRRRAGVRYRSPNGDRRVLRSVVGAFAVGAALVAASPWLLPDAPADGHLTLGPRVLACSVDHETGLLTFSLDVDNAIDRDPEIVGAEGLNLWIQAMDTWSGQTVVAETRVVFDTGRVDWASPTLELPVPLWLNLEPGVRIDRCMVDTTIWTGLELPEKALSPTR